ncbi:hypothetical protein PY257_06900, partial [Ramlibacter sp. H39-3-26]|uniref:hypothetical protein n=1 Tax=Curvibacter soli TaxID=3031331 RepID=UPI0023DC62C8
MSEDPKSVRYEAIALSNESTVVAEFQPEDEEKSLCGSENYRLSRDLQNSPNLPNYPRSDAEKRCGHRQ